MADNTAGLQVADFKHFEKEIRHLWRGLRELGKGSGQIYLVAGGSVGRRTRILGELAAQAQAAKIRVVALSAYDQTLADESLTGHSVRHADGFGAPAQPSVSCKIGIQQIHGRGAVRAPRVPSWFNPKKQSEAAERSRSADDFASLLEHATRANPVLLIVENLHEADSVLSEVVATATANGLASGVMIVATCASSKNVTGATSHLADEIAKAAVHIDLDEASTGGEGRVAVLSHQRLGHRSSVSKLSIATASAAAYPSAMGRGLQSAPWTEPDDDRRRSEEKAPVHGALAAGISGRDLALRKQLRNAAGASTPAQCADTRERCEGLIERGETEARDGENEAAENSLREAAILAERLEDTALLTRIVLALPAWHWPGPGEANPLAVLLARRALVVERRDSNLRAVLMSRLAAELSYVPSSHAETAELAAAAIREVTADTGTRTELYVRLYRDQVLRRPQQLGERLENAEVVSRLAIEAGDYGACCIASLGKVSALMSLGDIAGAGHAAEFAVGIMPASQIKFHHGLSAAYRAHRAAMDGRFEAASQEFDYCRILADKHSFSHLLDASWPAMLMPYGELGRLPDLEMIAEDTHRRRRNTQVYAALLAWLKVQLGRNADASFLLDQLAADGFANLSESPEAIAGLAALAAVCAALKRPDCAALLYDRLLPCADLNVTLNAVAMFGSAESYLGILASILGRTDDAIRHFERSYAADRRSGARPWAIYSGIELASALARRGTTVDRSRASELVTQLEAEASSLKMKHALSKINSAHEPFREGKDHLGDPVSGGAAMAAAALIAPASEPVTMFVEPLARELKDEAESSRDACGMPNPERTAMFLKSGEYWQVGYESRISSFKHRRGLELIALLLRDPEREFFAMELTHEGAVQPGTHSLEEGRAPESGVPVLDAEAKRSYRERLAEIREEIETLRDANEIDRAAQLEEEQDFLTRELASAIGLFGRDRKFNSESERARKRVSVAISRAIRSISHHDPHFGHHLDRSIRTGNLCSYTPDPGNPVKWTL